MTSTPPRSPTTRQHRRTAAAIPIAGMLAVSGVAALAVAAGASADDAADQGGSESGGAVTLEHISTVVRWNATDDDSQVWLTATDPALAIAELSVTAPDGREVFSDRLDPAAGHGQERLEYRSSEHTLGDLEQIYPPGEYVWSGRTADGHHIEGTTTVSYKLPSAPAIIAPADEATDVPTDDIVVEWNPISDAQWIFVEIEAQGDARELLIRLEGSATSLALPGDYLEERTEYEVELKAVHANGNQAATDSAFTTT
jgi:hypothetical protein